MRFSLRSEVPQWFLILAMFVLAGVFWSSAPDRIPVHWGITGEPDRYGGKFEGLLGLPVITLAFYALMLLLPKVDPRRANYELFEGAYNVIRTTLVLFFAAMYGFVLLWVHGYEAGAAEMVPLLVGALFIVLGNFMGKVRPNWFVGIRTPWTLSSKHSWVKTHRLGGWLFVLVGSALVVSGLWSPETAAALIVPLVVSCVVLLVSYSYLVWREDPDSRNRRRYESPGDESSL